MIAYSSANSSDEAYRLRLEAKCVNHLPQFANPARPKCACDDRQSQVVSKHGPVRRVGSPLIGGSFPRMIPVIIMHNKEDWGTSVRLEEIDGHAFFSPS